MGKVALIYICLTFAVAATTAYPDRSVDRDSNDNIEHLAKLVCKSTRGTKNLIGRISTFSKLVEYLGDLTEGHKLYDCRRKHLSPLAELVFAVETYSDDVCGDGKLLLLETYHRKYISRTRKHLREQKRRGGGAPELAQLFFMQYVIDVSSICEQSALKAIASNSYSFNADELAKVEDLRKFTDGLGMTDLSDGYKGIYLFWNMVDALDLTQSNKFSKYLSKMGQIRLNLQMKNAEPIRAVQAICRRQLKPLYTNTLLPVLRLVDMGYYPYGNTLVNRFSTDPTTRSLFFATQICETLLRLGLFSDPQLAEDQFVVITEDQASKLVAPPDVEGIEELPVTEVAPSYLVVDDLWDHISTPVETIKSNVNSRNGVVNRMLKQLAIQVKNRLKSMFSSFRLFSKGQDKKLQPIDEEEPALKDINLDDVQIGEEIEEESRRVKRSENIVDSMVLSLLVIFYSIYMALLVSLKIVLLTIPSLIALPYIKRGNKRLENILEKLWTFGDGPSVSDAYEKSF